MNRLLTLTGRHIERYGAGPSTAVGPRNRQTRAGAFAIDPRFAEPSLGKPAAHSRRRSMRLNNACKPVNSLSASLAQGDDAATRMLAACIELGEKSGRLDRALDIWADYYFTRQQYLRRVTSAVVYPLLLVIVALASILYSAWRLIPQYKQAFNQLAESQPAWLRALEFVELNFAWFAIVIVATTFTVLWRCLANRHGV